MEVLRLRYHSAATASQRKTFVAARAIRNGQKGEGDERAAEETVAKKKGGRDERTSNISLRGGRFTHKKF